MRLKLLGLFPWCLSALLHARTFPKIFAAVSVDSSAHATVHEGGQYDSATQFREHLQSNAIGETAWGYFSDVINQTGWASLAIHTNASEPDTAQAYAAGYLEGWLTLERIEELLDNMVGHDWGWPLRLSEFVANNTNWVKQQVLANPDDSHWKLVGLSYRQLEGLYDGYVDAVKEAGRSAADFEKFYSLTLDGDLYDLCVDGCYGPCTGELGRRRSNSSGRCSVLVKLASDDVRISHVTWSSFASMTRIYKFMDLQFQDVAVASKMMTFASYPGTMVSVDDYYQTDAGLVVTETTEANNNASLWQYVRPNTLLYWVRNLVANREAKSGAEWVKSFMRENSGTYNNQWIVLDLKQFSPGHAPSPGLLTILEQLPGPYSEYADVTPILVNTSFWASYNRAYFPSIYNISNQWELYNKYGDHFSYTKTARAQLFRGLQSTVHDDASLQLVMRHNNYAHESTGTQSCNNGVSASNAISERGDLTLASAGCISDTGPQDEAGTDAKYTSWTRSQTSALSSVAQSGPTHDTQPVFEWSQSPDFLSKVPHRGQPDRWDFDWVVFEW